MAMNLFEKIKKKALCADDSNISISRSRWLWAYERIIIHNKTTYFCNYLDLPLPPPINDGFVELRNHTLSRVTLLKRSMSRIHRLNDLRRTAELNIDGFKGYNYHSDVRSEIINESIVTNLSNKSDKCNGSIKLNKIHQRPAYQILSSARKSAKSCRENRTITFDSNGVARLKRSSRYVTLAPLLTDVSSKI
jgi:hypothetical protein